jgi:rhodanese-related sulfurtransferase
MASHAAAERAQAAGYKRILILKEGLKGWVAAGKPVDKKTSLEAMGP